MSALMPGDFAHLITAFLLPPFCLLLPGIAGLLLWHRRPAIARLLVAASLGLLWLFSMPIVADSLMQRLEGAPVALEPKTLSADAIVVLGAGTYLNAPEYGADTVSESGLVRLRYAARLQRETGKPVLLSGGKPQGNTLSEAEQMKAVLENEFHIPVKWMEGDSNNTAENARFTQRILGPAGIKRIYLVTHAWHTPRAAMVFRAAGFDVVPAPTAYSVHGAIGLLDFLPSAGGMSESGRFMHEVIGILWYRLTS